VGDRRAKEALFEQFARIAKAVAHAGRLELLELLAQAERSVDELAALTETRAGTVSAQLQELRGANLVEPRRDGTRVFYRLAGDDVATLVDALRKVAAAHLGDVHPAARHYLGDDRDVEPIDRAELFRRARAGDVVVVDVRPRAEYEAGHVPGAVSIPIDELPARLDELPPDVDVVAYCRGPYCVFAHDAVRRLRGAGRPALRLVDGLPEWRLEGLPVAVGAEPGRMPSRIRARPRAPRDRRP
jgi:rhodanese-related sulfurtransferase/DNA-binding transcriptional ArsR family regulator